MTRIRDLGRQVLAKLTPPQLQAWLRVLSAEGVSANRQRYARVVLRTALNTAVKWNLIARNPATLVDAPRVTPREIRPLAPDQARQFMTAISGHPLEALFTVALACGLRAGEALGLQWSDCDLEMGTLTVRQTIQRFGGDAGGRRLLTAKRKQLARSLAEATAAGSTALMHELEGELVTVRSALKSSGTSIHIVEPKSARSRRTLNVPAVVRQSLSQHRVQQLKARLAAGSAWQDTGFVFTSSVGTPLDISNLTRVFKAVLKAAKLPPIRLHDLRHSCATLLLAQGVNPRVVMELLGHSTVSLTLNTYSHVLPEFQKAAAAQMDAVLTRRSSGS